MLRLGALEPQQQQQPPQQTAQPQKEQPCATTPRSDDDSPAHAGASSPLPKTPREGATSDATACAVCGLAFGLTLLRHRCRRCESTVCGHCSKQRQRLSSSSSWAKVRVCDICVNSDQAQQTSAAQEDLEVGFAIVEHLRRELGKREKDTDGMKRELMQLVARASDAEAGPAPVSDAGKRDLARSASSNTSFGAALDRQRAFADVTGRKWGSDSCLSVKGAPAAPAPQLRPFDEVADEAQNLWASLLSSVEAQRPLHCHLEAESSQAAACRDHVAEEERYLALQIARLQEELDAMAAEEAARDEMVQEEQKVRWELAELRRKIADLECERLAFREALEASVPTAWSRFRAACLLRCCPCSRRCRVADGAVSSGVSASGNGELGKSAGLLRSAQSTASSLHIGGAHGSSNSLAAGGDEPVIHTICQGRGDPLPQQRQQRGSGAVGGARPKQCVIC